jgi:hypothetical protein
VPLENAVPGDPELGLHILPTGSVQSSILFRIFSTSFLAMARREASPSTFAALSH